jgi:hypothetical protein
LSIIDVFKDIIQVATFIIVIFIPFDLFIGANNLIPMEIALKLADKIKQKERFSVYIVIPMWPEGVLSSTATQRIPFCQVSFYNHLEFYHRLETIKISIGKL